MGRGTSKAGGSSSGGSTTTGSRKSGGSTAQELISGNTAATPNQINSMKAAERVQYYNSLPHGSRVIIESQGINGSTQTNTLVKRQAPTWNGRTWDVESGPISDISHFDTKTVKPEDMAYGKVKVKKVLAPGQYE